MIPVSDPRPRYRFRPAFVVAALAAAGLCFAARAQQRPGETPPAAPVHDSDEPDELTADELAAAVGEAEADLDGGVAAQPAEVMQVPAAAANAVVQHVDHPQGLALWKKARLEDGVYVAETDDGTK